LSILRARLSEGTIHDEIDSATASQMIARLRAVDPATNLPQYLVSIYRSRDDIRTAFPEVEHGETRRFANWVREWGWIEYNVIRLLGVQIPRPIFPRSEVVDTSGVDVIGFLHAEHGIGEASRLLVNALRRAGEDVAALPYRNTPSRQSVDFLINDMGSHDVVVTVLNAELNQPIRDTFGDEFFAGRYIIGVWFWELSTAPPWYGENYRYVNELWAPTLFIADMLRREAPPGIEIRHLPLPLQEPASSNGVMKSDLGIPDRFMFLFTFDFSSVMKRKNPLGLVSAFRQAFPANEGPVLVLKSINANTRPEGSAMLHEAIGDAANIVWIDEYFDKDQSAALMNLCDCYVSLHRSEGLGLTIAEAMLLGKPVIATGYSGNLDFMTPATSYLVPWKSTRVGRGAEGYPRRAKWAEPNLREAARLMRRVWENQDEARAVGVAAQRDVSSRFTMEICGAQMKARLEEIREMRHGL